MRSMDFGDRLICTSDEGSHSIGFDDMMDSYGRVLSNGDGFSHSMGVGNRMVSNISTEQKGKVSTDSDLKEGIPMEIMDSGLN